MAIRSLDRVTFRVFPQTLGRITKINTWWKRLDHVWLSCEWMAVCVHHTFDDQIKHRIYILLDHLMSRWSSRIINTCWKLKRVNVVDLLQLRNGSVKPQDDSISRLFNVTTNSFIQRSCTVKLFAYDQFVAGKQSTYFSWTQKFFKWNLPWKHRHHPPTFDISFEF